MKRYKAIKIVEAEPIIIIDERCDCNGIDVRGENLFLEKTKGIPQFGDYLIRYENGYVSWCPKDVFEKHNALVEDGEMTFGDAVAAMKSGFKVARKGWNGVGMFAYYVPANKYPASGNTMKIMGGVFEDDMVPYRHYLALKTAQGDVATWSPSTSDALATDWVIVN